jgi:hypothetical protein
MTKLEVGVALILLAGASKALAQDSLCNPCVDPRIERDSRFERDRGFSAAGPTRVITRAEFMRRLGANSIADLVNQTLSQGRRITAEPPPGVVLLPGYVHIPEVGIDSRVGWIENPAGLSIHYDIGPLAGNQTTARPADNLWLRRQRTDNRQLDIARRDDGLFVTFSYPSSDPTLGNEFFANFSAAIDSEQDVAEMLMIVLGYDPALR